MSKKSVKLTRESLRSLIREMVTESVSGDAYQDLVSEFVNAMATEWKSEYSEGDPSQSALGKEEWDEQVDAAVYELGVQVERAVDQITNELFVNAKYYRR